MLFKDLGIDLGDLILNTKSTIKNGIKFTNWSKDGKSYFHGFEINPKNLENVRDIDFENKNFPNSRLLAYAEKINNEDFCFTTMISDQNRVPYLKEENIYKQYAPHAIHFDARILANFLKIKV